MACSTCHVIVDKDWYAKLPTPSEDEGICWTSHRTDADFAPRLSDDDCGRAGRTCQPAWRDSKHDGLEMDGANSLFERLKATCAEDWKRYTHHDFVAGIADGTPRQPSGITSFRTICSSFNLHGPMRSRSISPNWRICDRPEQACLQWIRRWHCMSSSAAGISAKSKWKRRRNSPAWPIAICPGTWYQAICWICISLGACIVGYAEIGAWLISSATLTDGNPYGVDRNVRE